MFILYLHNAARPHTALRLCGPEKQGQWWEGGQRTCPPLPFYSFDPEHLELGHQGMAYSWSLVDAYSIRWNTSRFWVFLPGRHSPKKTQKSLCHQPYSLLPVPFIRQESLVLHFPRVRNEVFGKALTQMCELTYYIILPRRTAITHGGSSLGRLFFF